MIALSIALVIIAALAFYYFNKKLMLDQPPPLMPYNDQVAQVLQEMQERIASLENVVGMIRR